MDSLDGKHRAVAQMVVNGPTRFSQENQALVNQTMQSEWCLRDRVYRTAATTCRHINMD
jgi:hypothetical protein